MNTLAFNHAHIENFIYIPRLKRIPIKYDMDQSLYSTRIQRCAPFAIENAMSPKIDQNLSKEIS